MRSGPGYASAYGLVALLHHRAATPAGGPPWIDVNVRTHGSGNYRSILRGSSHGCHRLFNHLAIRLGSFLLARGGAVRHGQSTEQYRRLVRWHGRVHRLHAASGGYRFELTQPIDVDVLPGRPGRGRRLERTGRSIRSARRRPHFGDSRGLQVSVGAGFALAPLSTQGLRHPRTRRMTSGP